MLVLLLACSTTACATLLALPNNKDACMEPEEFAKLYTDFWIGPSGGSSPGRVLENAFSAILLAPVTALSYSVEHHICQSAKGQPEQGQISDVFQGPPESGQPLVPVEAAAPELDEGKIAGGDDACPDSGGNL